MGFIVFVLLWISFFFIRTKVKRATEDSDLFTRVFFRSIMAALCFGIGIIGGEGFALPGPIFASLVLNSGLNIYLYTSILPFAFWFMLFAIWHTFDCIQSRRNP